MTEGLVKQSIAELQDLVRCRCHDAYKVRGLHDPGCECDSADAVQVVADRIEELEAVVGRQHKRAETLAEGWRIADDARIELEAKLAKAVEALEPFATTLERYSGFSEYALFGIWEDVNGAAGRKLNILRRQNFDDARAALAELTGGKDD